MESGIANLLHMLQDRVKKLCEAGRWEEAAQSAAAAIEKSRANLDDDPASLHELITSIEIQGDVQRQYGDFEAARLSYLEALELLNDQPGNEEQLARISASVAVVYDSAGSADEAIPFYEHSVSLFEQMNPPPLLDVAELCNNLGYLYKSKNDFDKAELLYLKALQICNEQLGMEDLETASVCSNLGALYLLTGNTHQSFEMNKIALEIRLAKLEADDLDIAQSHSNLALVLAQNGDLDASRDQFEKSWNIYDSKVAEEPANYANISENYAAVLRQTGDEKKALAIEKRSAKLLKKVS